MKLQQHSEEKKQAVRGWDILSTGLGLMGMALIASSLCQPKEILNAIRLPTALVLMIGSVGSEKLRESDLLSLDEAVNFQKSIKTEKIKKDTMLRETIDDLRAEEELFQSVPVDRWSDIAQRTGIMPPNLEARSANSNPAIAQSVEAPEPPVQGTSTATIEPDPCIGGYDPEGDIGFNETTVNDCLIFAANVEAWFNEKGDDMPDSLIAEWRETPGIAIKVLDGIASIVRGDGNGN